MCASVGQLPGPNYSNNSLAAAPGKAGTSGMALFETRAADVTRSTSS